MAGPGLEGEIERLRPSLTGYCYRMLGSGFEAEDAAQETLLRAWRALDTFEGRAALRSWLYRIATNVCLDQLEAASAGPARSTSPARHRRRRRSARRCRRPPGCCRSPTAGSLPTRRRPGERAAERRVVRLAFVAALQHLPARQRVVLDPARGAALEANEVAELLETSVASVNSALQRARATLDELDLEDADPRPSRRRRRAAGCSTSTWRRSTSTTSTASSPSSATTSSSTCRRCRSGSAAPSEVALHARPGRRLPRLEAHRHRANGLPAFASYKPDPETGAWLPWSLTLLEPGAAGADGPTVAGVHNFLAPFMPNLFRSSACRSASRTATR